MRIVLDVDDSLTVIFIGRNAVTLKRIEDGRWLWDWSSEQSSASVELRPGEAVTVTYGDQTVIVGYSEASRYTFAWTD